MKTELELNEIVFMLECACFSFVLFFCTERGREKECWPKTDQEPSAEVGEHRETNHSGGEGEGAQKHFRNSLVEMIASFIDSWKLSWLKLQKQTKIVLIVIMIFGQKKPFLQSSSVSIILDQITSYSYPPKTKHFN